MRLVSFSVQHGGQTGTCTMITLSGAAGGLEANVRRWLGQLDLPQPPPAEWTAFLDRQEQMRSDSGLEGVLADLTVLGPQTPEAASMLAALFSVNGTTLFVKLTGARSLLLGEKDSFRQLCRSLRSEP